MPTYEYQCSDCGYRFEQLQKITEDALVRCPSCGKDGLKRLLSASAFHLKGSGWYKTDYSSSGSSGNASGSTGTASDTTASSANDKNAGSTDTASTPEKKAPADSGTTTGSTISSDTK
jgi:putative FmdB family regulatory protein